jgi:hypothetical protein
VVYSEEINNASMEGSIFGNWGHVDAEEIWVDFFCEPDVSRMAK